MRITNTFGTPEETKQIFNAVDEKLASIYKLVNNSMTDEQKALVIHDYLVSHAEYDLNYKNYTSYGGADGRKRCVSVVCIGLYVYSESFGNRKSPMVEWKRSTMGILMDVPLAVPPFCVTIKHANNQQQGSSTLHEHYFKIPFSLRPGEGGALVYDLQFHRRGHFSSSQFRFSRV